MTDGAGGIRGLTSEEAAEAGIGETVSSTYVRTQPLDGGVTLIKSSVVHLTPLRGGRARTVIYPVFRLSRPDGDGDPVYGTPRGVVTVLPIVTGLAGVDPFADFVRKADEMGKLTLADHFAAL